MITTVQTKTYLNYINGEWVTSISNEVEKSLNPADNQAIVGFVQKSAKEDLNLAVEAAKKAKDKWRKLAGSERGEYLYKVAHILEKRIDEIAECATREMGKTFAETKGETARGIAILKYYAGEGTVSYTHLTLPTICSV